jgi:xylulokinase
MVATREVVLGVDSSTQSTKVVAVDLETGEVVSEGRAPHTGADTQDPTDWWSALETAVDVAVTDDLEVRGIAVGGQQHGFVTLDAAGDPVRPAPLWNNVAAAPDAERLNELADFATEVGSRLVASLTIAKLAHLARIAHDDLARTERICLPHDYLNWRLTGELATDRSDASGSGWWSPATGENRRDLLALAAGEVFAARVAIPDVRGASEPAGTLTTQAAAALGLPTDISVGPGAGDNAAAAVGIGATPDELVISLGTSGVAFAVSDRATADPSGEVCGFADATGRFLPLVCMINCTRVVGVQADLFGWSVQVALDRAADIPPGADGLLLMPFLGGERTPNLPGATGSLHGVTAHNCRPELLVRSAVDGVAAGLAYCAIALARQGVEKPAVTLVGGGSRHRTWQQAIADATGLPVSVRGGGEHVARGAAVQIAAILRDEPVADLAQAWRPEIIAEAAPRPEYREAFRMTDRQAIVDQMRAAANHL